MAQRSKRMLSVKFWNDSCTREKDVPAITESRDMVYRNHGIVYTREILERFADDLGSYALFNIGWYDWGNEDENMWGLYYS